MKARQLIRHSVLFIVAFAVFGLSVISAIHLADYTIDNTFTAIWDFVQLFFTLVGLCTMPVFMISLFVQIVSLAMQNSNIKRKNTSLDTIAS